MHLLTASLSDLEVEEPVRRGDALHARATWAAGTQVRTRPAEPRAAPTGVAR